MKTHSDRRKRVRLLRTAALAPALVAVTASAAFAHGAVSDEQQSLQGLARSAPMILFGEVAEIVYRNSEANKEEPNGVPHTFVTYKVRDYIRGRTDGLVTLRFIGGSDGRGGVYMETTTPVFARGQTDILFVKGGAQDDCPLVGCVAGRFRIADDRVYNAWGVPVVEARNDLVIGGAPKISLLTMELPRPPFEELVRRPEMKEFIAAQFGRTSLNELRKRYEDEAPKQSIVGYAVDPDRGRPEPGNAGPPIRVYGNAMKLDDFLVAVKEALAQVPVPSSKPMLADMQAPIMVAPPKVAALRASVGEIRRSPEEQRESDAMSKENASRPTGIDLQRDQPRLIDPRRQPLTPLRNPANDGVQQ